ncbi:MAG TPA: NUDIX domain-containing protein [Candidatus Paceibacterota bacterium]|nr:NUDIX domain-containing protein [Candidatus Paceibacterota bacterium]
MNEVIPEYAGGFLFDRSNQTILIHLRDHNTNFSPGRWSFFGGLCESGETPKEAFVREMNEELSLNVPLISAIHLRSYRYEKLNTIRHIFYVESELKKTYMTLREGADFDWVALDVVFSYDITSATRHDIKFFIDCIL